MARNQIQTGRRNGDRSWRERSVQLARDWYAFAFCFAILLTLSDGSGLALAQDSRIEVKQTFVPNAAPETWPDRDKDWVPLSANELDQLLAAANRASNSEREVLWLDQADYTAVFDPATNTLSGEASWAWRSSVSRPSLLSLDPSNLSLRASRWQRVSRPAIVGSDSTGKQWLVGDDKEDLLTTNWSRSGRQKLAGIEFDLKLPRTLVSTIHLSLPNGWTLQSSAGLTQRVDQPTGAAVESRSGIADASAWRIDLGTATSTQVVLRPARQADSNENVQFVWTQDMRAVIRSGSVDTVCDIDLTPLGDVLPTSIDVHIPTGFAVQSVEQDDADTAWVESAAAESRISIPIKSNTSGRGTRLTLNLRRSTNSSARVVVAAPRVIRGLFQSGRVNVSVSSPIVVASYETTGLRQIESNATDDSMQMGFQQFESHADITITGSRANDNAQRINVREYAVFDDKARGDLTVDLELTSQDRGQFEFRGLFPRLWEITSITFVGQPDDARLQWAFEKAIGPNSQFGSTHQVLRIQVADGLPFKKPIRLRVAAELPNRANSKRESLQLPVVLSLHEGSLNLGLGVNSAEAWKTDGGLDANPDQLKVITLAELKSATQWTSDVAAVGVVQPVAPTLAWHAFVWDDAAPLAKTVLAYKLDPKLDGAAILPDANDAANANSTDNKTAADDLAKSAVPVVSMLLNSRIAPGAGRDEHALTWRFIYEVPLDQLTFRLPNEAALLRVEFNGQSVAATATGTDWQVPLSAVNAGDELTVKYTLPSQDVFLRGTYRCETPTAVVNVAGCRWNVEVPDSFAVVEFADEFTREDEGQARNPMVWLFGPLGRRESSRPFNLLDVSSWQAEIDQDIEADANGTSTWSLVSATCGTLPQSLTLHLCDRSRLHSMSWFMLVITVLIGVALRVSRAKLRGRVGLLWLTACIAASAIVPAIYAELIGAAILGTLFSTLIPRSMIRRNRTQASTPAGPAGPKLPSTVTLQRIPAGLIVLIGLLTWLCAVSDGFRTAFQCSVWAQSTDPPNPNEPLISIEILVPYLGRQFPADDPKNVQLANRVFITADNLRALTKLARAVPSKPTRSLVTSAKYVVSQPLDGRPQIAAQFKIAVLAQPIADDVRSAATGATSGVTVAEPATQTEIVLPIPARFLSGRDACRIDGVSIPVLPDADGQNVRITLPHLSQWDTLTRRPSPPPLPTDLTAVATWKQMELTLQLLPESSLRENMQLLRMPIPQVADTTLNMQTEAASQITIGRLELTQNADRAYVLGPANRLDVVWGDPTAFVSQGAYSVKLNSHLEFSSTWIERRTYAKYEVASGEVHQVCWKLPPGTRIDVTSIKANQLSDVQIESRPDGVVVVLEFETPQTNAFDVSFAWQQFLRTSENDQALWEIPILRPASTDSAPVTNHTIGALAASGFRAGNESMAATSDDVIDAWLKTWPENAALRRPLVVTSSERFEPTFAAVTPQKAFRTVQRQDQTIRISDSDAEWEFKAELTTSGVPAFRHELHVGSEVVIDSVSVESDDVDRMSHWYWDRRNGTVYLQLKAPTSGTQNVTLRGRLPISDGRHLSAPNARFEDATTNSTMLIFHPSDMHVHVDGAELEELGATRPDSDSNGTQSVTGRFQLRGLEPIRLSLERIHKAPTGLAVVKFRRTESTNECIAELAMQLDSVIDSKIAIKLPDWKTSLAMAELRFDDTVLKLLETESTDSTLVFQVLNPEHGSLMIGGLFRLPILDGKLSVSPPIIDKIKLQSIVELANSDTNLRHVGDATELGDLSQFKLSSPTLSGFDLTTHRFIDWDSTRQFDMSIPKQNELSTLVMHVVRTGKRRPVAGITRIFLNASRELTDPTNVTGQGDGEQPASRALIEIKLNMPTDSNIISVRVDDHYEVVSIKNDVAVLAVAPGSHQLDILWHQAETGQQLKIRRSQLELPTLATRHPAHSYCMIVPTKGTTVSGVSEVSAEQIDSMLAASAQWLDSSRGDDLAAHSAPNSLLSRMLTELQGQTSAQAYENQITSMLDRLGKRGSADEINAPNAWLGFSNEQPLVTVLGPDEPVEMWVVDQRLNQLLLGIFAAFVASPFLAFFLRLETSDLLAGYPMVSWCLIGLVWWTCLLGSLFGFVLFALTSLTLVLQWVIARHRRAKETI